MSDATRTPRIGDVYEKIRRGKPFVVTSVDERYVTMTPATPGWRKRRGRLVLRSSLDTVYRRRRAAAPP